MATPTDIDRFDIRRGIESPEYQKQRIERTLDKFSESTDQRDDITFLILKIREKTELPKED